MARWASSSDRTRRARRARVAVAAVAAVAVAAAATAPARADGERLPEPLGLADAVALARQHRAEIAAARARARAARERPAIAGALDDPMVLPSLDHVAFAHGGVDASLVVEQRFPLSRIRAHRRRAAEADARSAAAAADRAALDVELEAAIAFAMLREERQMAAAAAAQRAIAEQIVAAATARYGAARGSQAEVLRAEIEVSRLAAEVEARRAGVRAAEAMLNASIGRAPELPVPALAPDGVPERGAPGEPAPAAAALRSALERRPELRAGRAEVDRAGAELAAMRDMYRPMAMVQTGPSYTMAEGAGWMVMAGISLPLWRGKLRAGEREALAMQEMAQHDLAAMERMIAGDAVAARERVAAARTRWLALRDDIVPRARAALEPTLAGYASGQLPLVSALEAAQAAWASQMELAAAERELAVAAARLARATGQGGSP